MKNFNIIKRILVSARNVITITFGIFCFIFLFSPIIYGEDKKNKEIPPWMEDIKVDGRSTYLVPKGAKREIVGSHVVIETPNEYVARRVYEIEKYLEERFSEIEKNQKYLQEEVDTFKKALNEIIDELKMSIEQTDSLSETEN